MTVTSISYLGDRWDKVLANLNNIPPTPTWLAARIIKEWRERAQNELAKALAKTAQEEAAAKKAKKMLDHRIIVIRRPRKIGTGRYHRQH